MVTWLIDNGHGIDTQHKSVADFDEYLFNRNVLKYLVYNLREDDIPYHVLVEEEHDIPLRIRSLRANKYAAENGPCILLSIHGNKEFKEDKSGTASGLETWYFSGSGKAKAQIFQDEMVKELGWRDRGIKKGNFWILKHTTMPAVLVELGFYSHPIQRQLMASPEHQFRMGDALYQAIRKIS